MKANGFGRVRQKIIIIAGLSGAEIIARQVGAAVIETTRSHATLEWSRFSQRRRDDEDIVLELSDALFKFVPLSAYEIDWTRSNY